MEKEEHIGDRVKSRRKELGIDQGELAILCGVTQPAIAQLENGDVASPRYLHDLAEILQVDPLWLTKGLSRKIPPNLPSRLPHAPESSKKLYAEQMRHISGMGDTGYQPRQTEAVPDIETDNSGIMEFAFRTGETVPVYGMAAGTLGDREAVFNDGNIIDQIPAHPRQKGVKGAFALRVTGESMEPRYKEGEIVYLHPTMWPAREQDCVIEFENGNALLKTYLGQTETEIRCRQYNPDQELTLPKSKIKAVYAVLGRN